MKKVIKHNTKYLILALVCITVSSFFATLIQFIKGDILDSAIAGTSTFVIRLVVMLFLMIAIEIIGYLFYDFFRGRFTTRCMGQVRSRYFDKLISKSYTELRDKKQGEYISQYTNELPMIKNMYFECLPLLIELVIKILIVSVSLFILDYRIAVVTLLLLTMPLYVPKLAEKKLQKVQNDYAEVLEQHLSKIVDWMKCFEVIKNYSIEQKIINKFRTDNRIYEDTEYHVARLSAITKMLTTILSYLAHFVVLCISIVLVLRKEFTPGKFFIAVGMIEQLSYPIISVSAYYQAIISIKPLVKKHEAFIAEEDKTLDKKITMEWNCKDVHLEYQKVSFGYEEDKALYEDFSLVINEPGVYLITGASGSGKTTLVDLLVGYYQTWSGKVMINHIETTQIENLYDGITIMRQDNILFADTLEENLLLGQNKEPEVLKKCLARVGLQKFADDVSQNRDIKEDAINLSGGEQRRICLARSLMRDTPILILDEPFANLDEENMRLIEEEVLNIQNKVVLVVSHQFSKDKMERYTRQIELL